ncbi:hypothetical protein QYS49_35575 [Marivirga salinae]|uniref:Uncharacterized protein n=1 Tax=Marivirga salinarum TaxID=3059078 RepID=A0AA51N8X3_9BACT|nr:DUF6624 domain-containing protein [Marivirga sp. BDSF4-3]WMN10659.1 hypothetical protein QYS49_35575 [Marivirga sp. BDSF4-3]
MRKLILIISLGILLSNCTSEKKSDKEQKVSFNEELSNELIALKEIDQLAAKNARPPKEYDHLTPDQWDTKKDSIFRTHKIRLEEILKQYGYPGYDLVGEKAEQAYWLMVQHSDFDPEFQKKVLLELEKQVQKENANSRNFGLLTDRVKINTGQKQIYGTQVTYISEKCQAIPKPLEDSANVNKRRAEVGLPPIEEYLNMMSQMHFEMNKENMIKRGVTEPYVYQVPQ